MFPFSRDPKDPQPTAPAPTPQAPEAHPLDALTGGVFSAATSGERAQRVRDWLATGPAAEQMQAVYKELSGLDGGRLNIAACSLGGSRLALETAKAYMETRQQFGKPLKDFQALQFKLADMATNLEAARLMVHKGAHAMDTRDPRVTQLCAMAKRFATDACFQIADDALQLHGGYGYLKDYPLERIVRDLRVHRILEGTNEIMRVITAREMFRQ